MVDNLAIGLSHGLMLIALWRLLSRPDLDHEPSARRSWSDADRAAAREAAATPDRS